MHVIKRKGHKEKFDERKVYASVYSACKLCELSEKESEKTAADVTKQIKSLFNRNKIKDSKDISANVTKLLRKRNADAAFMYESHLDLC
jgi:transcriptional regulator NrdR family protein